MPLPTNRTTANTAAEHVADHNTLHAEYNTPTHTHSGTDVVYADYVPALTASSSNPTLGSASVAVGRYAQDGDLVHGWAVVKFGTSGAAAGSGSYRISLPVTALGHATEFTIIGGSLIADSSVGTVNSTYVLLLPAGGGDFVNLQAAAALTNSAPWAWAASDYMRIYFTYEAA